MTVEPDITNPSSHAVVVEQIASQLRRQPAAKEQQESVVMQIDSLMNFGCDLALLKSLMPLIAAGFFHFSGEDNDIAAFNCRYVMKQFLKRVTPEEQQQIVEVLHQQYECWKQSSKGISLAVLTTLRVDLLDVLSETSLAIPSWIDNVPILNKTQQ